jgi:predicted HTH domain antitoxin
LHGSDPDEEASVDVVKISSLRNNRSKAVRKAREGMVVVMNRDRPDALLVHLDRELSLPGVRAALATALFREGNLSLGRAARLAGMSLPAFLQHLSRLGIPAIGGSAEEAKRDMETLAAWLGSSSPTPAR